MQREIKYFGDGANVLSVPKTSRRCFNAEADKSVFSKVRECDRCLRRALLATAA